MMKERSIVRFAIAFLLSVSIVGATETEEAESRKGLRAEQESSAEFPLTCVVREWTFEAVQTDRNGKKCRGSVRTKACYGSCDSFEYGGVDGSLVSESRVCMHDQSVEKTAILTDCDPGVENGNKNFVYLEAQTCACSACNPSVANCENRLSKRTSFPPSKESSEEDIIRLEELKILGGFFHDKTTKQPGARKRKSFRARHL